MLDLFPRASGGGKKRVAGSQETRHDFSVADHAFHADEAERGVVRRSVGFDARQGADFNWVAQRRPCAVHLNGPNALSRSALLASHEDH